jgi:hypothetical protein
VQQRFRRASLACLFLATGLISAIPLQASTANAAPSVPAAVASASCEEDYSSAFGVSYNVRVDVDAYNLPASADGYTVNGLTRTPNTVFYLTPAGDNFSSSPLYPMTIANGQGYGFAIDNEPGGPYGYSVTVAYKDPNGSFAGPAGPSNLLTTASIALPDSSACGSTNVTSVSSVPGTTIGAVVAMAPTPDGKGYWMVGSDGRVFAYGDASLFTIPGSGYDFIEPNKPIVGIAATQDGRGYWLVASDGGIFAFGDAGFFGSTGGIALNKPIVGMAATPDGNGYWLVASDGGIFAFGDAHFYGSTGSIRLNQPVVGMASDPATGGYWLVASDGGVFSYNAPFLGSTGSIHLNKPIVGMESAPDGTGYRFVASDGGVFCYGVPFAGSTGSLSLRQPITGMAAAGANGYWLGAADGGIFSFKADFYGGAA